MFFTKRGIIALAVCFIVMFLGGNSLAEDSKSNQLKKGEVSAGVALIFPVIAAGYYLNNNVAVEGELVIAPTLGYLLSGNITYNWREPERRVNPFVLVGVGVGFSTAEPGTQDIIMTLGAGVKIRVTDWFYFRAEFRFPIYLVQ